MYAYTCMYTCIYLKLTAKDLLKANNLTYAMNRGKLRSFIHLVVMCMLVIVAASIVVGIYIHGQWQVFHDSMWTYVPFPAQLHIFEIQPLLHAVLILNRPISPTAFNNILILILITLLISH